MSTQGTEYLVSHPSAAVRNGDASRPFLTLDDALSAVGQHNAEQPLANGHAPDAPWVEIACGRPGVHVRTHRKPRYHFFVDAKANGMGGDGTELAPWSGMRAAVEELTALHKAGQLKLDTGQRIRLSNHEVFTPTSMERRKALYEAIAKYVLLAMVMTLVIPVIAIVGYLTYRAWPVLTPSFLLENPKDYMTAGGIWAPLVGTFFLVVISLIIAAPMGILAGVYLNEYARDNWFTRIINLAVVNLAGVPSIVHALFGVGAFVFFAGMGKSMLAAACTLAVMSLPVIITSTREALASVPMAFREACWNMGATRWQTIRTIVLPNSTSGMLTGVIFEVTRAAGETAPILFTGAVFFVPVADYGWESFVPYGLGDQCMALSYHLFTLATQVRGVSEAMQYGTAVVLIGLILVVNSFSIGLRIYLRSQKKW